MSDNKPAPKPRPAVELTKKPKAATNDTADTAPSRSIALALYAIYAQLGLAVLYAILSWPLSNQLHKSIIDSNNKAKAPKKLCGVPRVAGCLDVNKTVHTVQIETAVGTALVALAVILMVARIRRGIRSGRTIYIAASVLGALVGFAGSPVSLLAVASSGPGIPRVVSALAAASSVLAIVLLFRPDSQQLFNQKSRRPARDATGAPRPGLGSLLRPRPPVDGPPQLNGRQQLSGKPSPASDVRSAADIRAEGRLAKAKSRNDVEAVTRGAAMARNRAKASKSRRTDL
ncbi:MAG: hypothetical protein M3N95_09700 [Actinomycetota bacterium]|nr:hypothetical protein [Actinomycetota bacterium]